MRQTFGLELNVEPFNADFHSVIRVEVVPKTWNGKSWRKSGPPRDLMVEGAGDQQWLTVLAFALSPETNVLLLDEPDAHLFTRLKLELVDRLDEISRDGPQILMATHATEILKRHPVDRIMSFGLPHPRYLADETQRIKLVSGLGDEYAPLIEKARTSRRMLFVENDSDARILQAVANTCGLKWPNGIAIHSTTHQRSDRLKFYSGLLGAIDGLKAVSIRDRDNGALNDVDPGTLCQKGIITNNFPDFKARTWRRREIENYALNAGALVTARDENTVRQWWEAQGWAWPQNLGIDGLFLECDIKKPLGELLDPMTLEDFMKAMAEQHIHADLRNIAEQICEM